MKPGDARTFRFVDFELDLAAYQLRKDGRAVRLERRPMDLLILLVQRAGELVAREEIITQLWGDKVVIDFDTGLNTLIRKVRHALQDAPEAPTFIQTVAGKGYRFIAPLQDVGSMTNSALVYRLHYPLPSRMLGMIYARRLAAGLAQPSSLASLLILSAAWVWRSSTGSSRITLAGSPLRQHQRAGRVRLPGGRSRGRHHRIARPAGPCEFQVVGPTSTFAYKRGGKPLADIGERTRR